MLTCFAPGSPVFGRHPQSAPKCCQALLAGMLNATLLAIPLWLLILHAAGVI